MLILDSESEAYTIIEKEPEYFISYNLDGGINASGNPNTYKKGVGVPSLEAPTTLNEAWCFAGWYTNSNYKNQIFSIDPEMEGDIYLYAKWIKLKQPSLGNNGESNYAYINFGEYPQKEINPLTQSSIIERIDAALNARGKSTGDVEVDGEKYRKINKDCCTVTDNWFSDAQYRYFLWEPIKWRVLNIDATNNRILIMADEALDARQMDVGNGTGGWKNRGIRNFLNGNNENDFYSLAFSEEEKVKIISIPINELDEQYASEAYNGIEDKVFLLSSEESIKSEYGFGATGDISDVNRQLRPTAYAYAMGTSIVEGECTNNKACADWWLRTNADENIAATIVEGSGTVQSQNPDEVKAVVPAMYIKFDADISINNDNRNYFHKITYINSRNEIMHEGVYTSGIGIKKLAEPFEYGEAVDGWYSDYLYENKVKCIDTICDTDIYLYAKSLPIAYKIEYELNGGTNDPGNESEHWEGYYWLQNPVKEGFEFDGWYTDRALTQRFDNYIAADIKLYAKWKEIAYKITYIFPNESILFMEWYSVNNNPQNYISSKGVEELYDLTLPGATFLGWYFDEKFTQIAKSIPKETKGEITLYAKLKLKPYKYSIKGANADYEISMDKKHNVTGVTLVNYRNKTAINCEVTAIEMAVIVNKSSSSINAGRETIDFRLYVSDIGKNAFKGCNKLQKVSLGSGVKVIGKSAFSGCKALKTVMGGKNITQIGDSAFKGCTKLSSITLSKKLTTIGSKAFYGCSSLKKITLESNVSKIGSSAFQNCKLLSSVKVKTKKLNAKNVGSKAFAGISTKATVKVPLAEYKELFKKKGVNGKKQKIVK